MEPARWSYLPSNHDHGTPMPCMKRIDETEGALVAPAAKQREIDRIGHRQIPSVARVERIS